MAETCTVTGLGLPKAFNKGLLAGGFQWLVSEGNS